MRQVKKKREADSLKRELESYRAEPLLAKELDPLKYLCIEAASTQAVTKVAVSVSVSVFGIIQYNNYMGNNDKNITVTQESYGHPSLLVQESAMR